MIKLRKEICKKAIVVFIICAIIAVPSVFFSNIFEVSVVEDSVYYNILTVSAVFAGFAFTNVGLLLGISNSTFINDISNAGIMQNKTKALITSIVMCVICICLSLIQMLKILSVFENIIDIFGMYIFEGVKTYIKNILYLSIISYLLTGLFYFIKSTREVYLLILRFYEYERYSEQLVQEMKDYFNENQDDNNHEETEEPDVF